MWITKIHFEKGTNCPIFNKIHGLYHKLDVLDWHCQIKCQASIMCSEKREKFLFAHGKIFF